MADAAQAPVTQATYQITAPSEFSFKNPAEWPKWIRRFERFRLASGLNDKDEVAQVNTLLYTMGTEADDIFSSFNLTNVESESFDTVRMRFERHFIVRRNVIFERSKFNQRKQEPTETVESFVTDLYCLVEHCGYGQLKDEMIRDRIVVGLSDSKLAEALQLDPELTLTRAVEKARQSEAVKKQQNIVRGTEYTQKSDLNVDFLQKKKYHGPPVKGKSTSKNFGKSNRPTNYEPKNLNLYQQVVKSQCHKCGKGPSHAYKNCPANSAVCHKCSKRGHYAKMCNSSSVGTVDTISDCSREESVHFLGTIQSGEKCRNWDINIKLAGKEISFKIDTGADVTVIPEAEFLKLRHVELLETKTKLVGPGQETLIILGFFKCNLSFGDKETAQDIFVSKFLHKPLLGRPAIDALGIVSRVNATMERHPEDDFPHLFKGLGKLSSQYQYRIQLEEGAKPFSLPCPRRIPIPQKEAVQEELQRMVNLGVITPVEEPTEWCAGIVVVPKENGKVRICVDLTQLNKFVKRERFILPAVEYTLGQLSSAKLFSKLDANSGFWQIELSPESRLLTTFITPFGRFCFSRLPFGISSAPEVFQRIMTNVLHGLQGVTGQTDDTLVFGTTAAQHDDRLRKVLQRISDSGLTLNKEKCEFRKEQMEFLGQRISAAGVQPGFDKIAAIQNIPVPGNVTELKRFLGMAHYLGKFIPHLAEKAIPLSSLQSKKNDWTWSNNQEDSFNQIKKELTTAPTLALYDHRLRTRITTDASSYGLGAVLEQLHSDEWRPVAYASKTLTETQTRYSQIEKEGLGVVWGCDKFKDFLLGMNFEIVTDHKPLVPIFNSKMVDELSPRLQRFRLRLMRYSFVISHVPGKDIVVADTLSRAPQNTEESADDQQWEKDVQMYVNCVISSIPATESRLAQIKTAQGRDNICRELKDVSMRGWKQDDRKSHTLKSYWQYRAEFSVHEGLLMKGGQIVIPNALQAEVLNQVHEGHLGINKCKRRARDSIWWFGMGKAITDFVMNCKVCCKKRRNSVEPLIPTSLPDRPWQKVGVDLMEINGVTYGVVVDYYSRFPELFKMNSTTSNAVVNHMKSIFARYGVPEEVRSDNGPQFISENFKKFSQVYGFRHVTSSPHFPQSNGLAEVTVKTMKSLLKDSTDPYLALMAYRATPLEQGPSPAELLMGRKLRTTLPVMSSKLKPSSLNETAFREQDGKIKHRQKRYFDARHRAKELSKLSPGDGVWLPDIQKRGIVQSQTPYPRSYIVETPSGTLRRNRVQLRLQENKPSENITLETSLEDTPVRGASGEHDSEMLNPVQPTLGEPVQKEMQVPAQFFTRSGRASIQPKRLDL